MGTQTSTGGPGTGPVGAPQLRGAAGGGRSEEKTGNLKSSINDERCHLECRVSLETSDKTFFFFSIQVETPFEINRRQDEWAVCRIFFDKTFFLSLDFFVFHGLVFSQK